MKHGLATVLQSKCKMHTCCFARRCFCLPLRMRSCGWSHSCIHGRFIHTYTPYTVVTVLEYYVCKSDHLSKFNTNTWILYKKHIYLYLFTTEKFGKLLKYIFKMHHKNMKTTSETFTVSVKYYGGTLDLDFKHWNVMVQTFYLV